MKPRLLDLFCGAGGAAMGYHRAGFEVVGVDIVDQPNYPFEFIQGDALEYLRHNGWLTNFDAIHASPPCQTYSTVTPKHATHPDLYEPTRDALQEIGLPYVIENVIGAPYDHGIVMCGAAMGCVSDGEWIKRHRNFETSWLMMAPPHPPHPKGRPITVTGHAFISVTRDVARHSRQGTWELAQRLMGIDWMTRKELVQAIPPAYTEWIGRQLLQVVERAA
jgi:DNA (cytosine-5)-methyltransferase 1